MAASEPQMATPLWNGPVGSTTNYELTSDHALARVAAARLIDMDALRARMETGLGVGQVQLVAFSHHLGRQLNHLLAIEDVVLVLLYLELCTGKLYLIAH
jgi:hypothetical protein